MLNVELRFNQNPQSAIKNPVINKFFDMLEEEKLPLGKVGDEVKDFVHSY